METVDIYRRLFTSLGVKVNSDGELFIDKKMIKIKGKPLVIGTEHDDLDSIVLFNPIDEDLTKTDEGLKKLLKIITIKANATIYELVRLLITSDDDTELPSYLHILLVEMLEHIKESGSKTKKPLQASTITALNKLEQYCAEEEIYWFKPIVKNPVKDKGEKFSAGVVCSSQLLDEFQDTESHIHTLFKRKEDGVALEALFQGFYTYLNLDGVVSVTNSDAANLTAYMKFYMEYVDAMNILVQPIEVVAEELYNFIKPELKYSVKHIESLVELKDEASAPAIRERNTNGGLTDEWGEPVKGSNRNNSGRRGSNRNESRGRSNNRGGRDTVVYTDSNGGKYYEEDVEMDREGEFIYDEFDQCKVYYEEDDRNSRGRSNRNESRGRSNNRGESRSNRNESRGRSNRNESRGRSNNRGGRDDYQSESSQRGYVAIDMKY